MEPIRMDLLRRLTDRLILAAVIGAISIAGAARAQTADMPGVTATEIRIGNTMPYSGPASAYSIIAKTEQAYFRKINAEGGINGRKITFVSYDDAYSPPKAVKQARKLVESHEVLLIFNSLGTSANTAIPRHMNPNQAPPLFLPPSPTQRTDPH